MPEQARIDALIELLGLLEREQANAKSLLRVLLDVKQGRRTDASYSDNDCLAHGLICKAVSGLNKN